MSHLSDRMSNHVLVDRAGVNQALAIANVIEPIIFTTTRFDGLNEFTLGAGFSYFQPRRAGYYLVIGRASWATIMPNLTVLQLNIMTVGLIAFQSAMYEGHGSLIREVEVSGICYLTPNDQLQLWALCTVNPCNLDGNRYRTNFMIHRLS